MISHLGVIEFGVNYKFVSDFVLIEQTGGYGHVYLACEQGVASNSVLNVKKIPFTWGVVHLLEKSETGEIEIKGVKYHEYEVEPFSKGIYCDEAYHLARKIDYINRNLQEGRKRLECRVTHEGMIVGSLDVCAIETDYQLTLARVDPRVYRAMKVGEFVIAAIPFIVGVIFSYLTSSKAGTSPVS